MFLKLNIISDRKIMLVAVQPNNINCEYEQII